MVYDTLKSGLIDGTHYFYDLVTNMWNYFDGTTFSTKLDSEMSHEYMLDLEFFPNSKLYNCKANMPYLAINGTWINTIRDVAVVNVDFFNPQVHLSMIDYQTEPNFDFTLTKPFLYIYKPLEFDENVTLSTIRIDVYGYSKP